jgi:hypothetical protein
VSLSDLQAVSAVDCIQVGSYKSTTVSVLKSTSGGQDGSMIWKDKTTTYASTLWQPWDKKLTLNFYQNRRYQFFSVYFKNDDSAIYQLPNTQSCDVVINSPAADVRDILARP